MKVAQVVAIFDLDGTLVDTQWMHSKAESGVLAGYGVNISPEEITRRYAGVSDRKLFLDLLPNIDTQSLVDKKWAEVYRLASRHPLQPMPGMLKLVQMLYEGGHHIVIASASPRKWIETCLKVEHTDPRSIRRVPVRYVTFGQYFGSRYVSARECERGKPNPDVFLKAREITGTILPMEECWVIEDAASGVEAGLAAGMRVFFISPNNNKYDNDSRVTRLSTSQQIAQHICTILLS